jgi:hypothetical protein
MSSKNSPSQAGNANLKDLDEFKDFNNACADSTIEKLDDQKDLLID